MENKFGSFKIKSAVLLNRVEDVMAVMSQVAVTRCEHFFNEEAFYYVAYSEHFRTIKYGDKLPEYRVLINKDKAGKITVEFQEIENGN